VADSPNVVLTADERRPFWRQVVPWMSDRVRVSAGQLVTPLWTG
jgi:hypothetical protein